MSFSITCHDCGQVSTFHNKVIGQKTKCPGCGSCYQIVFTDDSPQHRNPANEDSLPGQADAEVEIACDSVYKLETPAGSLSMGMPAKSDSVMKFESPGQRCDGKATELDEIWSLLQCRKISEPTAWERAAVICGVPELPKLVATKVLLFPIVGCCGLWGWNKVVLSEWLPFIHILIVVALGFGLAKGRRLVNEGLSGTEVKDEHSYKSGGAWITKTLYGRISLNSTRINRFKDGISIIGLFGGPIVYLTIMLPVHFIIVFGGR